MLIIQRINSILQDGDRARVSGWGRTTNNEAASKKKFARDGVGSKVLRYAQVPIANDKCTGSFAIDDTIQICAGGQDGKS